MQNYYVKPKPNNNVNEKTKKKNRTKRKLNGMIEVKAEQKPCVGQNVIPEREESTNKQSDVNKKLVKGLITVKVTDRKKKVKM